jgi:hypothetical protein
MDSSRSFQPSHRPKRVTAIAAVLVVIAATAAAFAVPSAAQATSGAAAASAAATVHEAALARTVSDVPTLSSRDGAGLADLGMIPASMSCAQLAKTTSVAGQKIQIVEHQTASASAGSPQYCAVTGHINTYIGFEILLPISTWRQRYLQIGCGGLCGSISIAPPQTTGYKPLADGDFVLAAEDGGHSGNGTSWSTNAQQLVDFA